LFKSNITGIDHSSIIVADTPRALVFYCDLLGLEQDISRPDIGYPGAWLNVGAQQIHLLELPNPDPVSGRPPHGGRDRHIALRVSDLAVLVAKLDQAGVDVSMSKSGRKAAFCRDFDANAVELIEK
jgi:glyoxylase I family protein